MVHATLYYIEGHMCDIHALANAASWMFCHYRRGFITLLKISLFEYKWGIVVKALFARPPLTGEWCVPCQQHRVHSLWHILEKNSVPWTNQQDGELARSFRSLTTQLHEVRLKKHEDLILIYLRRSTSTECHLALAVLPFRVLSTFEAIDVGECDNVTRRRVTHHYG